MIGANIKPGWISDESLHWVLVQNQSGELGNYLKLFSKQANSQNNGNMHSKDSPTPTGDGLGGELVKLERMFRPGKESRWAPEALWSWWSSWSLSCWSNSMVMGGVGDQYYVGFVLLSLTSWPTIEYEAKPLKVDWRSFTQVTIRVWRKPGRQRFTQIEGITPTKTVRGMFWLSYDCDGYNYIKLYNDRSAYEGEVWDQETDGRSGQWSGRRRRIRVRL